MTRYVAIPAKAWASETNDWQERPSCTVFEQDAGPVSTGLLDAAGTPLFRVEDRNPVGFMLDAQDAISRRRSDKLREATK